MALSTFDAAIIESTWMNVIETNLVKNAKALRVCITLALPSKGFVPFSFSLKLWKGVIEYSYAINTIAKASAVIGRADILSSEQK